MLFATLSPLCFKHYREKSISKTILSLKTKTSLKVILLPLPTPIHSSKAGNHMLLCKIKYRRDLINEVDIAKKTPQEHNENFIILFNELIEVYKTYYALCLIFVPK